MRCSVSITISFVSGSCFRKAVPAPAGPEPNMSAMTAKYKFEGAVSVISINDSVYGYMYLQGKDTAPHSDLLRVPTLAHRLKPSGTTTAQASSFLSLDCRQVYAGLVVSARPL